MRRPLLHTLSASILFIAIGSVPVPGYGQQVPVIEPSAQPAEATKQDNQPDLPEVDPELQKRLKSPQATIYTFLDSVNNNRLDEAALCLDFSEFTATEEARLAKEQELAFKLKGVLDKLVQIEANAFPEDPGEGPISLNQTEHDIPSEVQPMAAQIILAKSADGLWRFSPDTVAAIEGLHEELLDREPVKELTVENRAEMPFSLWLEQQFPSEMQKTRFLLPTYQWIALAVVGVLGLLADRLTRFLLAGLTAAWFRFKEGTRAPLVRDMWRPVGLLVQGVVWYFATKHLIGLPTAALDIFLICLKFFAVVAAVWTAFHLIDLVAKVALRQTAKTETRFDDLLVPLVSKSLKTVAFCIGIFLFADTFGWRLTGLLGGLGIGAMAVAFAAQDAISNLFGSLTVLLDRPFEVGDWIVTDGVEGEVETVGFRSTRIRTFYNSLITLPNSQLTTAAVDNMGRRRFRRYKTILGVQYDTRPEQVEAFCEGVRELLRRHPFTRKDYFHVYFNDLSDSSLNILLYCFFECPDWTTELRERHRLLVDIMKLAERLGVQFAFPTRTLHMFQGDGTPAKPPVDCSDPLRAGQIEAAQIAGSFSSGEAAT